MPRAERPFMPGYGVPTDEAGLLPWSWAQDRLVASRNYWVVTASAAGRPHAMPVWGVWLPARERFVFSCSPGSRKARNIAENPQVVVAVEDTVECVSVEGRAGTCVGVTLDDAAMAYAEKYEQGDVARAALADFFRSHAVFEVTPERAFGIIERAAEFSTRATRWRWAHAQPGSAHPRGAGPPDQAAVERHTAAPETPRVTR